MRPQMNWRGIKKQRKRSSSVLLNFFEDLFSLFFSLPVILFALVAMLTVAAASQPGSGLPRYFVTTLNRYANTYESSAANVAARKSVISGLDCGKRSNPLANKRVIDSACVSAAVESSEAGAGSYISAWVANARLTGDSIAATAQWYRDRYLRSNRSDR